MQAAADAPTKGKKIKQSKTPPRQGNPLPPKESRSLAAESKPKEG